MTRRLVFIHGRSQEGKDSIALKKEWIAALRKGLKENDLALPVAEPDIKFPFYGDTLYELTEGVTPAEASRVIVRGVGTPKRQQEFIRAVLEETRERRGISKAKLQGIVGAEVIRKGPLNWEWVQGILRGIDRHVPKGSGASVAIATNDVYQYLFNDNIRQTIENGVRQALQPGIPTVVVSHSLGTVIAYRLLREEGRTQGWEVPLFVTLGSPLAVTAIRDSLAPRSFPKCVKKWFNAMDDRDVVALYPLDRRNFGVTPIENKTDVDNDTKNRHGITGYLDDAEVARRIHEALVA